MNQQTLRVHLGERSYDILVTGDFLSQLGAFARQRAKGNTAVVVTDENALVHAESALHSLNQNGFKSFLHAIRPGESQKSLETVSGLYDLLAERSADRRTLVVAVGGGVIGDLAGFVAATFARGIPLLMVPTTLLAMVDSSVGGKVGVNLPHAKNMIGAFHQPIGVFIDISTLHTLPDREFRSGLAEIVKYGVILDADLFTYVEQTVDLILQRNAAVIQRLVLTFVPS